MQTKILIISCALAISFGSGWQVRSWYEASVDLAQEKLVDAMIAHNTKVQRGVAKAVQTRLAELDANQTIVERHTREVTKREIYKNECVDTDGLNIINGLRPFEAAYAVPSGGHNFIAGLSGVAPGYGYNW